MMMMRTDVETVCVSSHGWLLKQGKTGNQIDGLRASAACGFAKFRSAVNPQFR